MVNPFHAALYVLVSVLVMMRSMTVHQIYPEEKRGAHTANISLTAIYHLHSLNIAQPNNTTTIIVVAGDGIDIMNHATVKRWVKVDHEIDTCTECGEGDIHIYSTTGGILTGRGFCEPEQRHMDYPFSIPDWCPKKVNR
jgi:hypothetical protein